MVAMRAKGFRQDIRLNLGCGGRPLPGYINVDLDDLENLKARYPSEQFSESVEIFHYDIFHLPFPDSSVSEVRTDSLVEHLSFIEEPLFFAEVRRVLAPGGLFDFSTPDFEDAVRLWLAAKDDWKGFYRNDPEAIARNHWFGNYSYSTENRWGYLMAMIFGSQNGSGQFHKNCYTVAKIRGILLHLGLEEIEISKYRWKSDRDLMIRVKAVKPGECGPNRPADVARGEEAKKEGSQG
jgi:predicted SAM-dependent methyltransferase